MTPVGQKGCNEDIGHAGQEVRFGQYFMMITDPVEKSGLAKEEQEGEDGVKKGRMVEKGIEGMQDQPVQVIVLRVQGGRDRVEEHGKFQYKGIYQ